jgi:hypothetical protein
MGLLKQNILQKSKMSWQSATIGHPARIAIIQSIKSKQLCCGYRKRITSRSAHGIPT